MLFQYVWFLQLKMMCQTPGSLDEESLQQAVRALSELSRGNRLVGIISHVAELKEKIDRQIIVRKDREKGSRVILRTD